MGEVVNTQPSSKRFCTNIQTSGIFSYLPFGEKLTRMEKKAKLMVHMPVALSSSRLRQTLNRWTPQLPTLRQRIQ